MHVSADPTELHKHARQAESRQHVKQYALVKQNPTKLLTPCPANKAV